MDLEDLEQKIKEFNQETHGSSDYDNDKVYVMGSDPTQFAPLTYLSKKLGGIKDETLLLALGYVSDSYDLFTDSNFPDWYEKQFGHKLKRSLARSVDIFHRPASKEIFDAIEQVNKCYEVLRENNIIMNGKNLPVQLGEWFAKTIFGLRQVKSASQRGFDFYLKDKRVEVKVHWADTSSPKGVKLRKSLVDLADYCIIMYVARNFMIREICFLDSDFVTRKFGAKGHTLFLKDPDVNTYFFSKSSKHLDKVVNKTALLKYSSPMFSMKLAELFHA